MRILWVTLTILTLLSLAACGSSRPTESEAAPRRQNPPPVDESTTNLPENPLELNKTPISEEMPSTPPPVEKLVSLAKRDLADRLKIDIDQITLVKTMGITWSNISAGCTSDPGRILTKGRIYGYRVWLEANGDEYLYHTGEMGQVILCPKLEPGANNPLLMTPGSSTEIPQDQSP